jgi:Glyoxalase-like domain
MSRAPEAAASAEQLAEHASAIRRLGKRAVEDIVKIGEHLIDARNFMRVAEAAGKSAKFADLLLAALYEESAIDRARRIVNPPRSPWPRSCENSSSLPTPCSRPIADGAKNRLIKTDTLAASLSEKPTCTTLAFAPWWSTARLPIQTRRGNYRMLETPPDEPIVEIQRVEHESRVHIDIETDDIPAEVARLEKLGAKVANRLQRWVVMEAPTGQRFCVVRVQRPGFAKNANRWD